jgi:hypothetical protein
VSNRLGNVRSYVAAVIAASICSLQAQALAFHVHAAPEQRSGGDRHTHAPAIHHHHHDDQTGDIRLSDASGNVETITLAVPAATSFEAIALDALPAEVQPFQQPELIARMPAVELHSHGPPLAPHSFLRGPPSSVPF